MSRNIISTMEDTTVVECETGACVSNLQTARIKISLLNNVNVPISNIININHLISARNSSHAITANSNSIRYITCVLSVNDMIDLSTLITNIVSRGTIIKSTRPKCNNSHAMATKCARFSQVSGQLALLYIVRSLSRLIISGLRSFLFAELIYQGELILTTIFIQNNHIMTDALATTTIDMLLRRLSGKEKEKGSGSGRMVLNFPLTDNSHTRHLVIGITQKTSLLTTRASVASETNTDILKEVIIGKKHNKIVMSVRTQFRENRRENSILNNT